MSALNKLVRLIDKFHNSTMQSYSLIKKAQATWTTHYMPDEPEDDANELDTIIDEAKGASNNKNLIAQLIAIVETCKHVINTNSGYSTVRELIGHFQSILSDYDENELLSLLVNLDAIIQTEARSNNINTKIPDSPKTQGVIRQIISDAIAKNTTEEEEEEKEGEGKGEGEEKKEEEDKEIPIYKKPGTQEDKSRFEQQSIIKRLGPVDWEEYYIDKIKDLRETLKGETNPEILANLNEIEKVMLELGKLSSARSELVNSQQQEIKQIYQNYRDTIANFKHILEDPSDDVTDEQRKHAQQMIKIERQHRKEQIEKEKAFISKQLKPQIDQIKKVRHEYFKLQRRLEAKINPLKFTKKREALNKLYNESHGRNKLILEQEIALIDVKSSQDTNRKEEIKLRTELIALLKKSEYTKDMLDSYYKRIENAKTARTPAEITHISGAIGEYEKIRSGGISGLAERLRKQIVTQRITVKERVVESLLPIAIKSGYFKKYEDAINNAKQAIKDATPDKLSEAQNYLIKAEQAYTTEKTRFVEEHYEQKRVQTNSEEMAAFRQQIASLDKTQWFDEKGNVLPTSQPIVSSLIQTGNNLITKYNKETKDGGFPEAIKTIQQIINVLTNPLTKEKPKGKDTRAFIDKFDSLPKAYQNVFKKLNISPIPNTYEDLKNLMEMQNKPEAVNRALQELIRLKFNPNIPIR